MSGLSRLPNHLKKYVVEQDYGRYAPEDQAVWRFILRQLRDFLSVHAHECYLEGLDKTGIRTDKIPRIEEIDILLNDFGWSAVPVSGFIPPAAFMEFQSLAILPIASDMRTLDHLLYTPAPDIVHEAAGHAPILIDPEFADYLKQYAAVAKNAIISREDLDQYAAIRELSDLKENPSSTPEQILTAQTHLEHINKKISHLSEATLLSRMNWWTAEYGLIGDPKNPKIYGAGLLSSVGESRQCLSHRVKKLPLDIHCVDVSYDITEPQPQLFVTDSFKTLNLVLEKLAERLAFRRGGVYGLEQAKKAETVNTVELNSGVQISGVLNSFRLDQQGEPAYVRFTGPCQLSAKHREWPGHGGQHHSQGFSTPLGPLRNGTCLSQVRVSDLAKPGLRVGDETRLEYASGIVVQGRLQSMTANANQALQILSFKPCTVHLGAEVLFDPAWGDFDLAIGETVVSVFGGPADRAQFGAQDDFAACQVPAKKSAQGMDERNRLYSDIRLCREKRDPILWESLVQRFFSQRDSVWLSGIELLEIAFDLNIEKSADLIRLQERLDPKLFSDTKMRQSVEDGLRLARSK